METSLTWYSEGDFSKSDTPSTSCMFQDGTYKGKLKVYSRFIAQRNNMNLHLLARCGATLGLRKDDTQISNTNFNPETDTPSNTNNCIMQLRQFTDAPDYITLWFGINDSGGCNLGTITDTTVHTFYGAYNWTMKYLYTKYPYAHIGIIISHRCSNTFRDAARNIALRWGCPYLDFDADPQVPVIGGSRENQSVALDSQVTALKWNKFRVSASNGHPNEFCHEYESTAIENFMRSL